MRNDTPHPFPRLTGVVPDGNVSKLSFELDASSIRFLPILNNASFFAPRLEATLLLNESDLRAGSNSMGGAVLSRNRLRAAFSALVSTVLASRTWRGLLSCIQNWWT